ncbi:olfactory receptor 52P1-like [Gastrophryne carolinensis]
MSKHNITFLRPQNFILIGIPGLEYAHIWISIPMVIMYGLTVLGNCSMLAIILSKEALHKPMYLLLSMLVIFDLAASTIVIPKSLSIFWFHDNEIGFNACLAQLFFIHSSTMMESTVLLAMGYDRYIAICYPLSYHSILTNYTIIKIFCFGILRAMLLMTPEPVLASRLSYCQNIISHTYCEHMAIVKIACSDTTINRVYGLIVALLVVVVDIVLILLSYFAIVRAVFRLSSKEARHKALGTCGSHVCVILVTYIPALFSYLAHRFGHNIPLHVHILFANFYVLVPPMVNPMIYGARNKEIRRHIVISFQKQQSLL